MIYPNLYSIAAVGSTGQIGLAGKLPWHDPEDLQWFKEQTTGFPLIIGWKTANASPFILRLPKRIVLVDDISSTPEEFYTANALDTYERVWVAGGERTYRRWQPHVRRSIITHVAYRGPADTQMPPLWERTLG